MVHHNTLTRFYTSHIYRVIDFINRNLSEPLNLDLLAQEAYFSPYHFHRIFTSIMGETPNAYVNRLRVERCANHLIRNPPLSITDIALITGFSSSAAFARSFKQNFGLSASEWRVYHKQEVESRDTRDRTLCKNLELNVRVRQMPGFHVAYTASLMDGYNLDTIDTAWQALCRWAAARDLLTPDNTLMEVSYDNPNVTPPHQCRYYACIEVPQHIPPDNVVGIMDIPAGKCAVYRFEGTQKEIQPTYKALYASWLPRNGYQPPYENPRRPCYAIFGLEPEDHPDGLISMDFCIPVVPV